ncbi:hypothetical protein [Singulisphaera sp. PoT]|uniref:TolB family protein n=1 Tax=Singulisphaera sp. PoT TaxID=3411797 RepID=UPI003BF4AED9
MRAMVARADGTGRQDIAGAQCVTPNTWTQFAGWSPDGLECIVGKGWESPENGRWEEEHKTFRFGKDGWHYDMLLVNPSTGNASNLTAVDGVSFYNTGLFFWPGDPSRLGFQALIDGNSHPYSMDRDGKNKRDLTKDSKEFSYGFSASPDGRRIAYHKSYQIHLADADGSHERKIETGHPFNFGPSWSPDGKLVLFLAGEHENSHPYVVQADGSGLRKLADRGGHRGVVDFLDVPDFHGGSSDVPTWAVDGQSVFYTQKVGTNIELFRVSTDGKNESLTKSSPGTWNYHPQPSPDGKWLAYGSKRGGIRQIYVMRLSDHAEFPVTHLEKGQGAMWPHWQPMRRGH